LTKSRFTSAAVLARNTTFNLASEGWLALVLFVAIPLLVKFLGEEQFGLFSLAWVVVGYLAFLDIGVSRATTKFVSECLGKGEADQVASLTRTALVANCVMGAVAAVIAVAISPFLVRDIFKIPASLHVQAMSVFIAVAVALPVLLVQGVLRAVLSSYQRFDWINLVNVPAISLQWVLATILAWKKYDVVAVVWVAVLARVIMDLVYFLLLLALVPDLLSELTIHLGTLRRLARFGAWVTVSQVISPLLVYLDRFLIAAFVSLAAVTVYTVPSEVFNRLAIFPSSLVATLFPAFSERGTVETEKEKLTGFYNLTTRYLAFILLPFFALLILEAKDILGIWMGRQFAVEGTLVLQILALGAFFNSLARLPFAAVQALDRPDLTAKFHLLELPIYVALCVLLIPTWGIVGAAIAWTIRVSLDASLLFWAAHRYCSLRSVWHKGLGTVLSVGVLLICGLSASHFLVQAVFPRLIYATALMLMAYVAIWKFALSSEDRPAIARVLRMAWQRPAA